VFSGAWGSAAGEGAAPWVGRDRHDRGFGDGVGGGERRGHSPVRAGEEGAVAAVSAAAGRDFEPQHLLAGPSAARIRRRSRAASAAMPRCWPNGSRGVASQGQTARRSFDGKGGAGPMHLISAFAAEARLVQGRVPGQGAREGGMKNSHVVELCWPSDQPCRSTVLAIGPAMSSNRVGGWAGYVVELCWRPAGFDGGHGRGCGRRGPDALARMRWPGWIGAGGAALPSGCRIGQGRAVAPTRFYDIP